jgi:hypothetical protein
MERMDQHPRTKKERKGRGFKQEEVDKRAQWVRSRIRACLEEDERVKLPPVDGNAEAQ